jgi:hypothetical protein
MVLISSAIPLNLNFILVLSWPREIKMKLNKNKQKDKNKNWNQLTMNNCPFLASLFDSGLGNFPIPIISRMQHKNFFISYFLDSWRGWSRVGMGGRMERVLVIFRYIFSSAPFWCYQAHFYFLVVQSFTSNKQVILISFHFTIYPTKTSSSSCVFQPITVSPCLDSARRFFRAPCILLRYRYFFPSLYFSN